MKLNFPAFTLSLLVAAFAASAQETTSVPHTFVGGEKAQASQINENFQALVDEIEQLKARLAESQPLQLDDRILIDATGQTLGTVLADLYSIQPELGDCRVDLSPETGGRDPATDQCIERNANVFYVKRDELGTNYRLRVCNGTVSRQTYRNGVPQSHVFCDPVNPYERTPLLFETGDCTGPAFLGLDNTWFPYSPYSGYYNIAEDSSGTPQFFPFSRLFAIYSPYISGSLNYAYDGGPLKIFEPKLNYYNGATIVFVDAAQNAYVTDSPAIVSAPSLLEASQLTVDGICEPLPTEQEVYCSMPEFDPGCTCGQLSSDGTQCVRIEPVTYQDFGTFSLKPAGFTLPNITLPVTAVAP